MTETVIEFLHRSTGLLKVSEAATLSGRHPETLKRRIHQGSLAAVKFGRDWRIEPLVLARYIALFASGVYGPHPLSKEFRL